jgi:hypothetical protein
MPEQIPRENRHQSTKGHGPNRNHTPEHSPAITPHLIIEPLSLKITSLKLKLMSLNLQLMSLNLQLMTLNILVKGWHDRVLSARLSASHADGRLGPLFEAMNRKVC